MSRRNRTCHVSSEANTFGNTTILRIIKTSICDLETSDPRLHRRNFSREPHVTDWLSVSQAGDPGVDQILGQEIGIQTYKTSKCILTQFVIGAGEIWVNSWHVVVYVDY